METVRLGRTVFGLFEVVFGEGARSFLAGEQVFKMNVVVGEMFCQQDCVLHGEEVGAFLDEVGVFFFVRGEPFV